MLKVLLDRQISPWIFCAFPNCGLFGWWIPQFQKWEKNVQKYCLKVLIALILKIYKKSAESVFNFASDLLIYFVISLIKRLFKNNNQWFPIFLYLTPLKNVILRIKMINGYTINKNNKLSCTPVWENMI